MSLAVGALVLMHPGRWLAAALGFDVAMYTLSTSDYPEGTGWVPWLLLDLFLFWRIWRGGSKARTVLIFLTLLAVALSLFVIVGGLFDDSFIGSPGVPALLCSVAALLCLLVPALDPQEDPFGRAEAGLAPEARYR